MSQLTKTDIKKIKQVAKRGHVKKALAELEERLGGMLTPVDVLDEARNPESPLHNSFEWDDSKAGEKYRLMQATVIIHSIRVEIMGRQQPKYLFAKLNVEQISTRAYYPIERVMSEKDLHDAVLVDAVRNLELAQEKYNNIQELKGVINTKKLRKVKEQIGV